ncbi:MAG: hypothetical protein FWE56_06090, partial [Candidatus Bathyarchaeota archaeon]|nr:hypothetical protein [Candidatus Termiticorpusculum sp.]
YIFYQLKTGLPPINSGKDDKSPFISQVLSLNCKTEKRDFKSVLFRRYSYEYICVVFSVFLV